MGKHRKDTKSRLVIFIDGQFLVLRKHGKKAEYGFIGGFVDPGETEIDALIRETDEEVKVKLTPEDLQYITTTKKKKITRHYFRLLSLKKKFKLNEPHKFMQLEWVPAAELIKNVGKSDRVFLKEFLSPETIPLEIHYE